MGEIEGFEEGANLGGPHLVSQAVGGHSDCAIHVRAVDSRPAISLS